MVLFFRDQDLSPEAHEALGRRIGELHVHPAAPTVEGHPHVMIIHQGRGARVGARLPGRYGSKESESRDGTFPSAVHPVVRTHPVTGRKALYVNRAFTTRIKDLAPSESRAILDMLFDHNERRPEFQCRFSWTPGAVAMWDNRSTQHYAAWDYFPKRRSGRRVSVIGERPF